MKRLERISALLMLLIYMTASTGSAAATLLCRHNCHCNHEHVHHAEECACRGYSFEDPCDGHVHMQYTGAYADRMGDSRQISLSSLMPHITAVCNAAGSIVPPVADDIGRSTFIDTPPPLSKAHAWVATLRAPPATV